MSNVVPNNLLYAIEAAALAIGRLDSTVRALEPGIQELLMLRCAHLTAPPLASDATTADEASGIIAILRARSEEHTSELQSH